MRTENKRRNSSIQLVWCNPLLLKLRDPSQIIYTPLLSVTHIQTEAGAEARRRSETSQFGISGLHETRIKRDKLQGVPICFSEEIMTDCSLIWVNCSFKSSFPRCKNCVALYFSQLAAPSFPLCICGTMVSINST